MRLAMSRVRLAANATPKMTADVPEMAKNTAFTSFGGASVPAVVSR
jgi:hypothetical protein